MTTQDQEVTVDDVRIADLLTARLRDAGHPQPEAWAQQLHPDAHKPDMTQQAQRFLANRALRTYIGAYQENTLAVRTALVDDGDTSDWVRHLDQVVIPCMLRNDLPPSLTSTASTEATPA